MTQLSEDYKLRLDSFAERAGADRLEHVRSGQSSEASTSQEPASSGTAGLDDAEAQMRRALGLDGSAPRPRAEPERTDPVHRPPERFGFGGHRRRFVQDGEIPVTVVRREGGPETGPARPGLAAPTSSRLQRVEAQLAAETAARVQIERALVEAQSHVRDLQTKLGHAELAKNEAIQAARRERDTVAALREEIGQREAAMREAEERSQHAEREAARLQDALDEERDARTEVEEALRHAEEARDTAERLMRELSEAPLLAPLATAKAPRAADPAPRPKRGGQSATKPQAGSEPEPIKWWLTPAAPTSRPRRR